MSAHAFLGALFAGVSTGFIELRPTGTPSLFVPLPIDPASDIDSVDAFLNGLWAYEQWQPFFGVAARVEAKSGRAENVGVVTAVIADIDFKKDGEEAAAEAVAAHPYAPSIIVNTGGGFHCYWLLDEPLFDMVRASRLLLAWGATVPASDVVFDLPRVLRLPGTLNRKYDPPRLAVLEVFEPTLRYAVGELEVFAEASKPERVAGEVISLLDVRPLFEPTVAFDQGDRHAALFKFMRSVVAKYALSWEELWPLMRAVNQRRCDPPIAESDLQTFLRRAFTTPHASGYGK